jgi:uncharacterized protein YndB with AHSA1/START domain
MVFDAFTKSELLKRWFGPRGWSLVVCETDFSVGGSWQFVLRGPDGFDVVQVFSSLVMADQPINSQPGSK